jgi:hypothetical protein
MGYGTNVLRDSTAGALKIRKQGISATLDHSKSLED